MWLCTASAVGNNLKLNTSILNTAFVCISFLVYIPLSFSLSYSGKLIEIREWKITWKILCRRQKFFENMIFEWIQLHCIVKPLALYSNRTNEINNRKKVFFFPSKKDNYEQWEEKSFMEKSFRMRIFHCHLGVEFTDSDRCKDGDEYEGGLVGVYLLLFFIKFVTMFRTNSSLFSKHAILLWFLAFINCSLIETNSNHWQKLCNLYRRYTFDILENELCLVSTNWLAICFRLMTNIFNWLEKWYALLILFFLFNFALSLRKYFSFGFFYIFHSIYYWFYFLCVRVSSLFNIYFHSTLNLFNEYFNQIKKSKAERKFRIVSLHNDKFQCVTMDEIIFKISFYC